MTCTTPKPPLRARFPMLGRPHVAWPLAIPLSFSAHPIEASERLPVTTLAVGVPPAHDQAAGRLLSRLPVAAWVLAPPPGAWWSPPPPPPRVGLYRPYIFPFRVAQRPFRAAGRRSPLCRLPSMIGWQIAATGAISLVGATIGALVLFQERLLYHPGIPSRAHEGNPADYGLTFSDVPLVAADGTLLHAWLLHAPSPGGGRLGSSGPAGRRRAAGPATVLYFHGNAGNISHRLPDAVRWVRDVGVHVLLVSYRGYGQSQGSPTEAGLRQDAQAALDWALAGGGGGEVAAASGGNGGIPGTRGSVPAPAIDPSRVWVFGRSLGGAVGLALAAANPPPALAGVIVENTFTSINSMIDVVLPPLRWAKPLNRNVWDSAGVVGRLDLPMLFMSGADDELVPPRMMKALYERATAGGWGRKKMVVIAGGTHNDTWYVGGDAYYSAIREFVERAASAAASAAGGGAGARRLGSGGGQRLGGGGEGNRLGGTGTGRSRLTEETPLLPKGEL